MQGDRNFTDDLENAYVITKPAFASLTEALEDLSRVTFTTTEEHVDAGGSRMKRDDTDVTKIKQWPELHNAFAS